MTPEKIVELGLAEGMAVAVGGKATSVNFRLANNSVTTNGREESSSVGMVALEQGRVGVQAGDLIDSSYVAELARQARVRAQQSPEAPDAMPLLTPGEAASRDGDAPGAAAEALPADLEPILDSVGGILEQARSAGIRCFGYAQATASQEQLGTSTGVSLEGRRQNASLTLTLKTSDLRRSVWGGATARRLADLDPTAMYRGLSQRLAWTEKSVALPAGHYQVLLAPSATSDMVVRLMWEMHARGADEGRTVFAGKSGSRVGEAMYSSAVNLESDPLDPQMVVPNFVRCLGSSEYASVFDNGLAVPATVWVEGGVQQELICPRRWAQDHGHPVRPDVDNLTMRGTDTSLDQMIASSERALLVTSLWYIRDVDRATLLLTGLTRDGVFLIEHGEVVGAVNNFRFNESPVGVLQRTVEVGKSELAFSREVGDELFIKAPPIRVENFFMSSVSDAI
ncbi:MAG TPA: metallopeptidase TldD-related protein [Candidatus Dormibacteraeota bacterium]|nr:metallopeptidase TldD-related protein [Candidatus Dormibacteraeota bacterium]